MTRLLAASCTLLLALPPVAAAPPTPTPTAVPAASPTPSVVLHGGAATPKTSASGSLAETVRRAKASATPVPKKSLGAITNESIKKSDGTGKGSLQVGPARPIAQLPPPVIGGTQIGGATTEASWRARAADTRKRADDAEEKVKRLEVETKRLENDFYAWSDGNYRDGVIKPAWDQAREDLRKARAELDAAQAALADLEEEARKAGVPPGWLRDGAR